MSQKVKIYRHPADRSTIIVETENVTITYVNDSEDEATKKMEELKKVDPALFDKTFQELKEVWEPDINPVNERLLQCLKEYRSAQRQILEKWSEGDHHVKARLWKDLHQCEDAATEAIEIAEGWEIQARTTPTGLINSALIAATRNAPIGTGITQKALSELLESLQPEPHFLSTSDPRIHAFVKASKFAMRLLSQNSDDAVAQVCVEQLAKAIEGVTIYGTGPMIQERPRPEDGSYYTRHTDDF
ncbi:MAG: hypothetical protein LCH81_03570 [Bacteroidetes bacterium]|nr:hypothetical protein [Bacteroidota bacterium]